MGLDDALGSIGSDDPKFHGEGFVALEDRIELVANPARIVGMDVSEKRLEGRLGMTIVSEDSLQLL